MKHFTIEEANDALRRISPLAEEIVACRRELAAYDPDLEQARRAVAGNGGGLDRKRVAELEAAAANANARLARCVEEITDAGAHVKDLDRGLVDFPARHPDDRRTVLLCWHLGEEEIRFWHGVEEGFAGRKPLPF
jgi:hypothetical protein